MGWKVIFAPQALEQLEQIVRFIAQDDPTVAERFGNYLVCQWDLTAESNLIDSPFTRKGLERLPIQGWRLSFD
jgi:plasmid stabilization system protein ParE